MTQLMINIVIVVHVLVALGIIGLVLLQHGKGADMGSGFGSGSSGSLFGATGSANFLSRMTAALATIFFVTSLGLAYLGTHRSVAPAGVMEGLKQDAEKVQPEAPNAGAPVVPQKSVPPNASGAASKASNVPE
jgi:preprotein translocase subunit SecG